jgi:hypothetical protein
MASSALFSCLNSQHYNGNQDPSDLHDHFYSPALPTYPYHHHVEISKRLELVDSQAYSQVCYGFSPPTSLSH